MPVPVLPPSVPESALAADVVARLPEVAPPPPWACRVEAVVWWHRASAAALAAVPAALGRPRWGLVVGAAVRYLASPVGPYDEVLAGVLGLPLRVHVPFIAVDDALSAAGGRAHWALPKVLARSSRTGSGLGPLSAVMAGDGWRVRATAQPHGPRLPVAGLVRGRQVGADGRPVPLSALAAGRARIARVDVEVDSEQSDRPDSIARWLRPGPHPGAVLTARLRVGR